jgi:hypothetical protein
LKLAVHPEASQNYNKRAESLVSRLRPAPEHFRKNPDPPNPNIHTSFTLTPNDIIGEMTFGWADFVGTGKARAFAEGAELIGLFGEDYEELRALAEGVQKSITPRGVIGTSRLSELIFDWIKQRHRDNMTPTMIAAVLSESEKIIKDWEIWIPISRLYIQAPFVFGNVSFKAITKPMIDDWEARALAKATTPEETKSITMGFEKHRKDIQGLATAIMRVEAEHHRGYEIAFDEIDKTVGILRFLSPANFHPAKICYSAPFGSQHVDTYRYLIVNDGKIVAHYAGLTDKSRIHWNLTNNDLATWLPELQILSSLLAAEDLTDFQEALLEALTLYSRSSLAKHASDKLIFILTALESIFLKDRGEFIQDSISLRMAFMQDVSVDGRRKIIDNVKTVYALRSSFVHHGHDIDMAHTKTLTDFMMNAWLSLAALILLAAKNITKKEFFDYLENRRLAG